MTFSRFGWTFENCEHDSSLVQSSCHHVFHLSSHLLPPKYFWLLIAKQPIEILNSSLLRVKQSQTHTCEGFLQQKGVLMFWLGHRVVCVRLSPGISWGSPLLRCLRISPAVRPNHARSKQLSNPEDSWRQQQDTTKEVTSNKAQPERAGDKHRKPYDHGMPHR